MARKPTGNPIGRPRTTNGDVLVERRRARQRAYYWANRDQQLQVARERYLRNKAHLTDEEVAERDRIASERSALASKRNNQRRTERKAQKRKMQRRALRRLKLERGCIDCGYNAWASALHFDHRPGTVKLFEIGASLSSRSWADILIEIRKCDVRCANCHHRVTDLRRYGVGT